jgi:hypothetical protein
VLWWIAACLCSVLSLIYYLVLFFSVCDSSIQKEIAMKRETLDKKKNKTSRDLSKIAGK